MPFRSVRAAAAAFFVALSCLASSSPAQTFTYQGLLQYDGALPEAIDVRLAFFDSEQFGEEIDSIIRTAVPVDETGVFTLDYTIDSAAYETDAPVWIEIGLRLPGEIQFQFMQPRQRQTFAPRAGYATAAGRAEVAEVALDHPWTEANQILSHGLGSDRVAINRGVLQSSTEIFGIHRDTDSLFAGMYATTLAGGQPFYGYAALGSTTRRAYHSFDTGTSVWSLTIGSDTVLAADNAGVQAEVIESGAFAYASSQPRRLNLSKWDFFTTGGFPRSIESDGLTVYRFDAVPVAATLRLPSGAEINLIQIGQLETTAQEFVVEIHELDPLTGGTLVIALGRSNGTGTFTFPVSVTTAPDRSYALVVTPDRYWPDPAANGATGAMYLRGARVSYTVDQPD